MGKRCDLQKMEEIGMCNKTEETNFSDVSGAVAHLFTEGWKASISTFYQHQQRGKIRRQSDGTYTPASLRKYAKTFLRRRDNATLLKEMLDRELAKRTAFLRNDFEVFCRTRAAEIVALVNGDPGKIPDLVTYLLAHTDGGVVIVE
jgi:hypothetical protein